MRMISELYGRFNYISGLKSLFSTYIREYDIAKANISILYTKGVISKELYEQLLVAPREERQITIGLMQQKDPKIVKILQQGIFEAKKALFELNQIQDADILTIKNDAGMVCAIYTNLAAQKPLFRYLDKTDTGKILAVFCLRNKTEAEIEIEELKARQQVLDGAVGDLGAVTSAMADQIGGGEG